MPGAGVVFDYTYTANSNLLASIANTSSGWTQTRIYETSRNVLDVIETKFGVSTKAKYDYTVDDLGRRRTVSKTGEMFSRYGASGVDTHWDYNDRSEVTNEVMRVGGTQDALPGRTLGFDYDFIGNRKTASIDGRALTYARNAVNQYDSVAGRTFSDVTGLAPAASPVYVNGTAVPAANRMGDYFFATASPTTLPAWQDAGVSLTANGTDLARKFFLPSNPELMTYDADGNLTSDGRWNYTYDAENRLISMETKPNLLSPTGPMLAADAKRLEFTYDYMGRRVEKLVRSGFNGTAYAAVTRTRFIYEGWNLASEYTTIISGSTTTLTLSKTFTWGLDWSGTLQGAGGVGGLQFIRDHSAGASYFPVYDGNGNIMGLVNTTGAFSALYEYDAFGQTLRAEGTAANANHFRFSTKFTDNETGLVYYGLRYYIPSLGRFVNRDPIEERGGVNLYAFVRNSPVGHADLLGMFGFDFSLQEMDGGGGFPWNDWEFDIWNKKGKKPTPRPLPPEEEPVKLDKFVVTADKYYFGPKVYKNPDDIAAILIALSNGNAVKFNIPNITSSEMLKEKECAELAAKRANAAEIQNKYQSKFENGGELAAFADATSTEAILSALNSITDLSFQSAVMAADKIETALANALPAGYSHGGAIMREPDLLRTRPGVRLTTGLLNSVDLGFDTVSLIEGTSNGEWGQASSAGASMVLTGIGITNPALGIGIGLAKLGVTGTIFAYQHSWSQDLKVGFADAIMQAKNALNSANATLADIDAKRTELKCP